MSISVMPPPRPHDDSTTPRPSNSAALAAVREPAATPLRVGAVSYLNSKPLIEGLETLLGTACVDQCDAANGREASPCTSICQRGGELTLDYPSRLADQLASGELDVALIPSVEAITGDGYQILSDACVASKRGVRSVKLYSRVPIGEMTSLALDEGSRTSAALTRTILSERFGVEPELHPFPLGSSLGSCDSDAVLMIGDRAMHSPDEQFEVTWDLGEEWYRWTGLPFVFAVWVARPKQPVDHVSAILSAARDRGISAISGIAERDAEPLGISVLEAERYLRENLHFRLGSGERQSLRLFERLARTANVI